MNDIPAVSDAGAEDTGNSLIPGISEDGTLFPIEKMAAHRTGQLHAAVSVFVFSGSRLLVQQRAGSKYHSGFLWANTCCTHPHWGEPLAQAAHRRLREELGVDVELEPAGTFEYRADVSGGLVEHERVQIYRGALNERAVTLAPDPAEVAAACWIDLDRLRAQVASHPQEYAPWFVIYLKNWDQLGL